MSTILMPKFHPLINTLHDRRADLALAMVARSRYRPPCYVCKFMVDQKSIITHGHAGRATLGLGLICTSLYGFENGCRRQGGKGGPNLGFCGWVNDVRGLVRVGL